MVHRSYLYMLSVSNVVEAHGYGFRSTVVSGEHSRSKTSAIIAMYNVSTTGVFVRYKTFAQFGASSGARLWFFFSSCHFQAV